MGAPQPGQKAAIALVSTPADMLLTTIQRNHVGPSLPAAAPRDSLLRGGGLQQQQLPPSEGQQRPACQEIATLQVRPRILAWAQP